MSTVHHTFDRAIQEVFAALADPRTYLHWLVGARELRAVDPEWPAPGSSFHHRVGLFGPLTIADRSTSCAIHAPELLVLEVRARPLGRARVAFRLREDGPSLTTVSFSEEPIGPAQVLAPVAAPLAALRNARSLDALDRYLEEHASTPAG